MCISNAEEWGMSEVISTEAMDLLFVSRRSVVLWRWWCEIGYCARLGI